MLYGVKRKVLICEMPGSRNSISVQVAMLANFVKTKIFNLLSRWSITVWKLHICVFAKVKNWMHCELVQKEQ
jgi:hypothetical protein